MTHDPGGQRASLREERDRAWAIVDRQEAELSAARAESDRWKADHDYQVTLKRRTTEHNHRLAAELKAARAESDALRAALEAGHEREKRLGEALVSAGVHPNTVAAIALNRAALAPSPAEPAAPERCAFQWVHGVVCGRSRDAERHTRRDIGTIEAHAFVPAAPEPVAWKLMAVSLVEKPLDPSWIATIDGPSAPERCAWCGGSGRVTSGAVVCQQCHGTGRAAAPEREP